MKTIAQMNRDAMSRAERVASDLARIDELIEAGDHGFAEGLALAIIPGNDTEDAEVWKRLRVCRAAIAEW